jgi:tetratricopeptide (TPR) repeat protein
MKSNHLVFIGMLLLMACKPNPRPDVTADYTLLERNARLQHGKEWEQIHNTYTQLIDKIRKNPTSAKPYIELAELCMIEARVTGEHGHYYPQALSLLEKGLENAGKDEDIQFRALSDKASVQLSLHQFEQALVTAQQAVRFNPYNAQIYGAMVDAYLELGQYKQAVEMADKMVSIRPDLRSYSRVSYLREIYDDIPGAIEAMRQAVESGYPGYEESAWARLQLGNLIKKSGDIKEAELQFLTILEERPNYPFAIHALAELKMEQNDLTEAEKLLDQAIELIPEVSFYITKAELKKKQGHTQEALAIAQEVIKMLQDDEKAGHKMDITYAQVYSDLLGDRKKSLEYALREYDARPENIEVNQYLADLYRGLGDQQKADQHQNKTKPQKI